LLFRSKYKIYYLVKLSAGRDSIVSVALSLPRSKFYITICLILIILFAWDNLFALYSFVKFGTGRLPLATVCFPAPSYYINQHSPAIIIITLLLHMKLNKHKNLELGVFGLSSPHQVLQDNLYQKFKLILAKQMIENGIVM